MNRPKAPQKAKTAPFTRVAVDSGLLGRCNARCKASGSVMLANSADVADLDLFGAQSETIDLSNGLAAPDGWALISKYGDHPHPKGPIQRFEKPDAETIVTNYKSLWGRVKRAVVGIPLFNGHPDAPGYGTMFPDKTIYGTWGDLEARTDGLYGRPVLTVDGSRLVEDGKDRLSPYWKCVDTGEVKDGRQVVAPFRLVSVGLVKAGNIPGPSLMNSLEQKNQLTPTMKEYLIKILAALGQTIKADAPDTEFANAADASIAAHQKLVTDKAALDLANSELTTKVGTLTTETTNLANAKATAETAKTTAETERDSLKGKLSAERKERATLLANAAVTEGRIAGADRDAQVTLLCNAADFDAEATKLAKTAKRLKTTPSTQELANSKAAIGDRQQKVLDLVNARMTTKNEDYETAFGHVQKENAALFAAMQTPQAKS